MKPTPEQIAKLPKWAQEEWSNRENELRLARALCWPTVPKPSPLNVRELIEHERTTTAKKHGNLVVGWSYHAWDLNWRVTRGCSNGVNHSSDNPEKTSTQGAGRFYDTRLDALICARWDVCAAAAKAIAAIDKAIEEETL